MLAAPIDAGDAAHFAMATLDPRGVSDDDAFKAAAAGCAPINLFGDHQFHVGGNSLAVSAETVQYLTKGGRVLLLSPEGSFSSEPTIFRLASWDGGGPSGTEIANEHPALRGMPNEGWGDLQFFYLIQGSKSISLDSIPGKIEPIVRFIDRPQRLSNRAYLFEASVGKGKLVVSGFNFARALEIEEDAARAV
jgi:hypothetical protein